MADVFDNDQFRKILRKDPTQALEILYSNYYRSLLSISMNLIRDISAAKDIVHDAILYIYSNNKSLSRSHEKSIERYLIRIVRLRSISFYRKTRHVDIEDILYLKLGNMENPIETDFIKIELHNELRKQINTFTKRQRQCMLMKIDKEMTLDQIAARLRISRKMVEKAQTAAVKRLKEWGKIY